MPPVMLPEIRPVSCPGSTLPAKGQSTMSGKTNNVHFATMVYQVSSLRE